MNPMFSFFIAIISLMPAIIFVVFFKILLTILNRGKRKFNEDFHEEERNLKKSKNFHDDRRSDADTLANEIKRIIKEEKEKEKNKKISKEESKKNKKNVLIDKDPRLGQRKLKEKLLEKKEEEKKEIPQENLSNTYNLENTYNLSETYNLSKTYNLEKNDGKIVDSEFIRECESDQVFYEDENGESLSLDFLDFAEEDLPKIIVYKEIFGEPLSLR